MLTKSCWTAAILLCGCSVAQAQNLAVPTPASPPSQKSSQPIDSQSAPANQVTTQTRPAIGSGQINISPFPHGLSQPSRALAPIPDPINSAPTVESVAPKSISSDRDIYPSAPFNRDSQFPRRLSSPSTLPMNQGPIPMAPGSDFDESELDSGSDADRYESIAPVSPRRSSLNGSPVYGQESLQSAPLYTPAPGTVPYSNSQYNSYSTDAYYGSTQSFTTETGHHIRHPFYSYRRPWFTPGPASYNVNIIW